MGPTTGVLKQNHCFVLLPALMHHSSGVTEAERVTSCNRSIIWHMSDKSRKQARWWESGVKSHHEAEHRSPPTSLCSLCITFAICSVWTFPSQGDFRFTLAEIYTGKRLESGHSFSGQLPPLPRVTFHLLLEVLIAGKFTASHHRFEWVHEYFCHLQKPLKTWRLYPVCVKTLQLLKYWNVLQSIVYASNSWQIHLKKDGLTFRPKWGYKSISWNHKERNKR